MSKDLKRKIVDYIVSHIENKLPYNADQEYQKFIRERPDLFEFEIGSEKDYITHWKIKRGLNENDVESQFHTYLHDKYDKKKGEEISMLFDVKFMAFFTTLFVLTLIIRLI